MGHDQQSQGLVKRGGELRRHFFCLPVKREQELHEHEAKLYPDTFLFRLDCVTDCARLRGIFL